MTWADTIQKLQGIYEFKAVKPLSRDVVEGLVKHLNLDSTFFEFYLATNGLSLDWFRVLPIEDSSNIKNTWDSIQKANDLSKSKFEVDDEFLKKFVIFAEIGGGAFAAYDKSDGSIWFEEDRELSQTDLSLEEFIKTCLREVSEL